MTDTKKLSEVTNIDDLSQCTSCEGFFDTEKIEMHGEDVFCKNCSDGIIKEVRQMGIDHLDEFLKNKGLIGDFNIFASAKWSGVTEEEYREINN